MTPSRLYGPLSLTSRILGRSDKEIDGPRFRRLRGTVEAVVSPFADLHVTQSHFLSGAIESTIELTGQIRETKRLIGTMDAGVEAEAALRITQLLSGTMEADFHLRGHIWPPITLRGEVSSDATYEGSVTVTTALRGEVGVDVALDGKVYIYEPVYLRGEISSEVRLEGDASITKTLSGSIEVDFEIEGNLTNTVPEVEGYYIHAWGDDSYGQVSNAPTGASFVAIVADLDTAIALAGDGAIHAWGVDSSGEVSDVPTGTGFVTIDAAGGSAYAIDGDGAIHAWGNDAVGQVSDAPTGLGFVDLAPMLNGAFALDDEGRIYAWGSDSAGQVSDVPAGVGFVAISAGASTGFALDGDGRVHAWGYDSNGQVSNAPTGTGFVAVVGGNDNGYALDANGAIHAWGHDGFGQISDVPTGTGFVEIIVDQYTNYALDGEGRIHVWGYVGQGQLTDAPTGTGYSTVASFRYGALALDADGVIHAWGNDNGTRVSTAPSEPGFVAVAVGDKSGYALSPIAPPDDADLIISAMTTAPSPARQQLIKDTVTSLKTTGVWDKLDCLYMLAAHEEQASRINWKAPGLFDLTQNGPGVYFTIDYGWETFGGSYFLESGFDPSIDGHGDYQHSKHIGITTTLSSSGENVGMVSSFDSLDYDMFSVVYQGANDRFIVLFQLDSDFVMVSNPTTDTETHFIFTAEGDPNLTLYGYEDASGGQIATGAAGLVQSSELSVLNYFNSVRGDSNARIAHWGQHLTSQEVVDLDGILQTYLDNLAATAV